MPLFIHELACEVPEYKYPQSEIASFIARSFNWSAERASALQRFFAESGIDQRYSVLPDFGDAQAGSSLKADLSHRMQVYMHEAQVLASNVTKRLTCLNTIRPDVLITVSCTGLSAPGWDTPLIHKQGWQPYWRTAVNFMGCHGLFHALQIAYGVAAHTPSTNILIIGVELCTLHFDTIDTPDQHRAHALFGDGACAIWCSGSAHQRTVLAEVIDFQTNTIPDNGHDMAWHIGRRTFIMKLTAHIPKLLRLPLRHFTDNFLKKHGLAMADVDLFAIHPGGKRILQQVGEALGLQPSDLSSSHYVLQHFGNMSSVSIAFVLQRILQTARSGKGLALGFGPGITIESMLFECH